jgi:CheY-like chemotaxis protein
MTSQNCNVLIVEDSDDLQILLSNLLKLEGYEVQCAETGRVALNLLQSSSHLPHVIMLDLMMKDMDGYAFREVQLKTPRIAAIPVIVMTADGDIRHKSASLNAQAYLQKPFRGIDSILETVGRFC